MFYSYTSLESETLIGNYITCIRHSQMCTCVYTRESYKCTSTTNAVSRGGYEPTTVPINLNRGRSYYTINPFSFRSILFHFLSGTIYLHGNLCSENSLEISKG
jgi:hypothetical protein